MQGRVRQILESADVLECVVQDQEVDNNKVVNKFGRLALQEGEQSPPEMTQMICLGLGSPSADASGWRHIVLWQLVAFLSIAELCMYLFRASSISIKDLIFPSTVLHSS